MAGRTTETKVPPRPPSLPLQTPDSCASKPSRGWEKASQKHSSQHFKYRIYLFQIWVSSGWCSERQLVAVTQKASVLVGTINHMQPAEADWFFVILQRNCSLPLSYLLCFSPFLSSSLSFFFLFKIFLETLFCQSLSAATQAWVKQQQMHDEMRRLGNELRRVRGRE